MDVVERDALVYMWQVLGFQRLSDIDEGTWKDIEANAEEGSVLDRKLLSMRTEQE